MKRFNRACRHEVHNANIFKLLEKEQKITEERSCSYNQDGPNEALEMLIWTHYQKQEQKSILGVSTLKEALRSDLIAEQLRNLIL